MQGFIQRGGRPGISPPPAKVSHAQGERVPERDFHVATVVKNRIVVFGGRSDVFAPYFTANDIYPSDFFYYELGEYMFMYVWNSDALTVHVHVHVLLTLLVPQRS